MSVIHRPVSCPMFRDVPVKRNPRDLKTIWIDGTPVLCCVCEAKKEKKRTKDYLGER